MGKDKLKRFAAIKEMDHVWEPTIDEMRHGYERMKGKWGLEQFGNDQPIVLELGCGGGEYTIQLARQFPEKNFIGLDIKGARIFKGAKIAIEDALPNVAFLRARIDFIESFFTENEVSEIWITFPDPHEKMGREKKRLTHPCFLKKYKKILSDKGLIHLKTDSLSLMNYTLGVIEKEGHELLFKTYDVYGDTSLSDKMKDVLFIRTFYEKMWLEEGKQINYVQFRLNETD